jgi:thiol-disulfide isomerase/thioredoxin
MVSRLRDGSFEATVSAPVEANRPKLWNEFERHLRNGQEVNYHGREIVAGESCDLVEFVSVIPPSGTPGGPKPVPSRYSVTYYVTPAGFIVQQRTTMNGGSNYWNLARVTSYDAKTRLGAEDFSREAFDRAAARLLRPGEPMPVLTQALFRPGERLPEMAFIDWTDRKPFRFSDLQGKVVVVETWASWCGACKQAFPTYERMRRKLAAQDVVFVAISFDHQPAAYEKWMKANSANYGFKFGLVDAPNAKEAMKEFKGALPAFYVLGRDGVIVSSYGGWGYPIGAEDPRLLKALRAAGVTVVDE